MEKFEEGWQEFIKLCSKAKESETLSPLFDLLLTPEEKESIAMRCLIIRELLLQEKPQREIAKELNVSIAKITRGSNEMKRMNSTFMQFLKKQFLK